MVYSVHITQYGHYAGQERTRLGQIVSNDQPLYTAAKIVGECGLDDEAAVRFARLEFDKKADVFKIVEYGFVVKNGRPYDVGRINWEEE